VETNRNRFSKGAFGCRQFVGKDTALPRRDGGELGVTPANQPHPSAPSGFASQASFAPAASSHRGYRHPVAWAQVCHAVTASDDFAGELVTENETFAYAKRCGILRHMKVGAANSTRGYFQQYLVLDRLWRGQTV
jgi:hypothetical protein